MVSRADAPGEGGTGSAPEAEGRDTPERRSQGKDALLGLLGHELRNSLAPISMALDMLRRSGLDTQRATELSEVAARQMRQAVALIDELSDLARALAGTLVLHPEHLSLGAIVASLGDDGHGHGQGSRGAHIEVHCPPLPTPVYGDPTRLGQMLNRLIDRVEPRPSADKPVPVELRLAGERAEIRVGRAGSGAVDASAGEFDLPAPRAPGSGKAHGFGAFRVWFACTIAELHGGRLEAWRGAGTDALEFRVFLPLVGARA